VGTGAAVVSLEWDERQVAIARLALSQLSYATDTGEERAAIAQMLADLSTHMRTAVAHDGCGNGTSP
jgi:hypothetical protein